MNPYKTPEVNLETNKERVFKPVKAVLYGLFISVIITSIVSGITSIIFAVAIGVDFTDEIALESVFTDNTAFMFTDIIISGFLLYFAGTIVGKHVPGQEIKYGIMVSIVTLAIYLALFIATDAFSIYPTWYNFLSLIIVLLAIYFGAKSSIKTELS